MDAVPAGTAGSAALQDAARAADALGRLPQAELALALSLLMRTLLAVMAAARRRLALGCAGSILLLLRQSGAWLQEAAMPATRRQLRRLRDGLQA